MQIEALRNRKYINNKNNNNLNKTLKAVLINNHIKPYDENNISFNEIEDSLLICDSSDYKTTNNIQEKEESSFNTKRALKPLICATALIVGGCFALSSILKKSSSTLLNSKNFEQLPDLAVNMNIKEEPQFAIYRAIRDPNSKNILGAAGIFLMSGITIACKNFVDGAKEIWLKKQSADIEKNLQENLVEVETNSFSGKLKVVNDLMAQNKKYFEQKLTSDKNQNKNSSVFSQFTSFKGNNIQQDETKANKKINKNIKYAAMIGGVILSAAIIGKISISNLRKTVQNCNNFANGYTEKTIEAIKNISKNSNKEDVPKITELLKSICAKPDFINEIGKKYNMNETEINTIIKAVEESKKTIFADAPMALGGIPKKIQYYCYIDENRGHLYNWILNPENKFTKYIFAAFTLSGAIGYLFKQGMDAIKEAAVMKENAKTELDLRKKLVAVEIKNFKAKKESAINPLLESFEKDFHSGRKTKEELKQIADNILTETKNGPPYVYT